MKYRFYCEYCDFTDWGNNGQMEIECLICDGTTKRLPRPEEDAQESEKSEPMPSWFAKCVDLLMGK